MKCQNIVKRHFCSLLRNKKIDFGSVNYLSILVSHTGTYINTGPFIECHNLKVMAARIIEGNRGGKVLIYKGFKYQKNKERVTSIHWRCWRQECRSNLRTSVFDLHEDYPNIQVLDENEHTHEEDGAVIGHDRILRTIRSSIRDDPSVPIKRLYNNVTRNVIRAAGGDREHIPEFHRIRTTMTRARLEHVPEVPHAIDDVVIRGTWRRSWSDERYLLHQDNDWGMVVYATDDNLKNLRKCSEIYLDGTFRTCPRPYNQYFTIHGKFKNRALCFVCCLMTNRTVGDYRHLLQTIKTRTRQITGHRLRPNRVVCDFEQALIASVETEFPNTHISGCYFHFCQNLWRKVQTLGLSNNYRNHRRLRKCIRKVMAIGYLPLAIVRQNFNLLQTSRSTLRLCRRFPELRDFLNYFNGNYLNGTYLPQTWNVYDRNMDNRTNNSVESEYFYN